MGWSVKSASRHSENIAMFELTAEQRQELDRPGPAYAVDPKTKRTYVLVAVEDYERTRSLLSEDFDVRSAYPLLDAVAAKEGWNDPEMESYNIYARKPS
jgi:hypothetical protein